MEPILKTENLWKLYRAGKVEVPALRGVNFEVQPGESVAVMGPSGCGKSSLLYVIGGLAQASRGKVLVDGNDLATMSDSRAHQAPPPQNRLRLPALQPAPHADRQGQHRHRAVHSRRWVRPAPLRCRHARCSASPAGLHHKPSELSGGEQQRVAIARAIINEPKILLADEPTGNLDSKNSEVVLQMLRQLNKDLGQTIVMITHNPEATTYFDRVVHMRDGIIVDGVPAD